jgi:hypothetical protein
MVGLAIAIAWTLPVFPMALRAQDESPARLSVTAQVRTGACYVGQSVDLSVSVVVEHDRPQLTMPVIAGADVRLVAKELKPISVSGIGDAVFERNLFRSRYRLIPRRAGTLTIPSIPARLGERRGASAPLTLTVRNLPTAGRPAEFLGGVGSFEVEASAEPSSVRAGESLEFRVTIRGPAARGVTSAPDLTRLDRLPLKIETERRGDLAVADPPSHTFVYRLRPTRAGEATLPPVAIAAFDPKTERYVTRVTLGIPIRVTDVPKFDATQLRYGHRAVTSTPAGSDLASGMIAVAIIGLSIAAVVIGYLTLRSKRSSQARVRRSIDEALSQLNRAGSESECARAITEGLVTYLAAAIGRREGALTPVEAEDGIARATGSVSLAGGVRRLIERCDEVLYGEPAARQDGSPDLRGLAQGVFLELAKVGVVAEEVRQDGREVRGGKTR